jgi:hypothetical protein
MIVVFLQRTLKEKVPIFLINTLLLHIPLLALTDRQNDGRRDKFILVGLGNLRFLQVNLFVVRVWISVQEAHYSMWSPIFSTYIQMVIAGLALSHV